MRTKTETYRIHIVGKRDWECSHLLSLLCYFKFMVCPPTRVEGTISEGHFSATEKAGSPSYAQPVTFSGTDIPQKAMLALYYIRNLRLAMTQPTDFHIKAGVGSEGPVLPSSSSWLSGGTTAAAFTWTSGLLFDPSGKLIIKHLPVHYFLFFQNLSFLAGEWRLLISDYPQPTSYPGRLIKNLFAQVCRYTYK